MKMEMYSIWDRKTQVMMPPVCYHNRHQAKRELTMFLESNPTATVAKFPDDFALMMVGTWDDHEGRITPVTAEWICSLQSLIPKTAANGEATESVMVIPRGSPLVSSSAESAPPSEEAGGAVKALK